MSPQSPRPTREEVLDAFAVEQTPDRETLERYLRAYPQFTNDLVDLSREIARAVVEDQGPLSRADAALIDRAWKQHSEVGVRITDPFAALSHDELRSIAMRLDVPRQVITAFRERKVDPSTVPNWFLTDLATSVRIALQEFLIFLSVPTHLKLARSYSADEKPSTTSKVPFEQILIEAGVSEEKRTTLMAKRD